MIYNICKSCKRAWFIDESGALIYPKVQHFGYAVVETCRECKGKVPP